MDSEVRQLRIRRPGSCCICRSELDVGETAGWDASARSLTCLRCLGVGGHTVTWPQALRKRLLREGSLGPEQRQAIGRELALRLPPAS